MHQDPLFTDDEIEFLPTGARIGGTAKLDLDKLEAMLTKASSGAHGALFQIADLINHINRDGATDIHRWVKATGYDAATLVGACSVARRVPLSRRCELSFEHHKLVASLPEPEQEKWLQLAQEHSLSKRHLRRSILVGRVLTEDEFASGSSDDSGQENVLASVSKICSLLERWETEGLIESADNDGLYALHTDLLPVVTAWRKLTRVMQGKLTGLHLEILKSDLLNLQ